MLKRFVLIYLGFAALLSGVLFTAASLDEHARLAQLAASELRYVGVARERAEKDFEPAEGDIRIIANMDELQQYVDKGDALHREKMERYFLLLCRGRQHYHQVRYLDADGQEDIRINYRAGKATVVPREALQDKSDTYYFRQAMQLGHNDIYVSPLDLNVEYGLVEVPRQPVIRFATPMFDSAGRKQGVVVLNYIADEMLQHFREAMRSSASGSGMLLNQDGFWLSSPDKTDEWGFMLNRPQLTFGHRYPEAWRKISVHETGTVKTAEGLFVYTTAHPLMIDEHPSMGVVSGGLPRHNNEYDWKIVSFTPWNVISAGAFYNRPTGRVLTASAYLLLAMAVFGIVFISSRQKKAEEAIREMALLLEMAPGPVMRIDRSGKVCLANSASKQLYGPAEVEGMSIFTAIPGLSRTDFEGMFVSDAKIIQVEAKLGEADYFFVLRNDSAQRYVFAYGADITASKLLEEQVRQAQKMEVVGQLAGGVAHDFNTLIGVILGYGEMLRDDLPEGGLRRSNIESIINAGRRAKALVRQLMDFSRLGTTRQEPVQLVSLLSSTVKLLSPSLPGGIKVDLDIDVESSQVFCNATQIGQVIMNLCMNSADAMADDGGELRITLKEAEVDASMASANMIQPGSYLQLTVADNGCGMDPATIQHLFEPFFTTKDVGRGTGLGLAVVHGIVKSHGGFVTVESESGKGSRFHVFLPRSRTSWKRNEDNAA